MEQKTRKPISSTKSMEAENRPGMWSTDAPGLYLKISDNGGKSWAYRYQIAGKRRTMGLGVIADLGLADARAEAAKAAALVRKGIDPIDARDAAKAQEQASRAEQKRKSTTLRQAVESYVEIKGAAWKSDKHRRQWSQTMAATFDEVIDMPVEAVTVEIVEQSLGKIWTTRTETADRLLGRVCAVIDFAKIKGWRDTGAEGWEKHLRAILPSVPSRPKRIKSHKAMPYADLPAFWRSIASRSGMPAAALRFVILTAGRSGEIRGARAQEFDLNAATWTIPAERMKAGREHVVTLSSQAVEIVRPLLEGKAGNDLVFEGERKGSPMHDMTLARLCPGFTVHGFRSSFRDWVAEETDFDSTAAELCLAHVTGSATERAYRRGAMLEKRRGMMQAWANYLSGES